ncbi:MAG: 3-phosphoshikimate 1-carboxyvinyltransferase [Muribaculaceae bacterium]|nr:3-phosphoshikimate 1-carboxyvinyltransferase [Muribaculaceae bacterium]
MIYHLNIGSNLGDREANLRRAVDELKQLGSRCMVSSIVESEPWGYESDNAFLNVGVMLESDLEPLDMLHRCQAIERQLGSAAHRDEHGNYVDRLVDIDIILAGDLVINTPELTVPHPRMHERGFVMTPLKELLEKLAILESLESLESLSSLEKETTMNYKITSPASVSTSVALPTSKSLATRILIINALSQSPRTLTVTDTCDDIDVMRAALASDSSNINVGAAGTAMRFLTAYFATRVGRTVTIDGTERMRQRPIRHLVDALRLRGACIDYVMNEGFPPLRITGKSLDVHEVAIDGSMSSQYVTALLLTAPVTGGCTLRLTGNISSRPYIEMTLGLMRRCGITVDTDDTLRTITVHEGAYTLPHDATIETDWSAASYWVAMQALLPSSSITLKGLTPCSLQGDSAIMGMCDAMGVACEWNEGDLHLSTQEATPGEVVLDMESTPDIIPTIAATLCLQRKPFTITGVRTLRIKESDRIAAMQNELAKVGYTLLSPTDNSITYDGNHTPVDSPAEIETYKDHRIAMVMALASTRHTGVIIKDAAVVAKSYPLYWQHLQQAGFTVTEN